MHPKPVWLSNRRYSVDSEDPAHIFTSSLSKSSYLNPGVLLYVV